MPRHRLRPRRTPAARPDDEVGPRTPIVNRKPPIPPASAPRSQTGDEPVMRPRHAAPDAFEQNPLSQVSERISMQATEGIDDAVRVREALRMVIAEGVPVAEAARRCQVAPSFLTQWREKYQGLLNDESSIARQPLMETGTILQDADLVRIPQAAREQFAENWERLVEITHATPSMFRQHPVRVFLENSWLTSWLFHEGKLDRGVVAGASVVTVILVLTATFLMAGHFYRRDDLKPQNVETLDAVIRRAAEAGRSFFTASGAEEKMKYVRAAGPAKPLMEDYFRHHPAVAMPDAVLTLATPGDKVIALEFDIPSLHRKHLCFVVDHAGQSLVDWETCSLFQEANIQQIRQTRPRTPVRVAARVTIDVYYNYGFTKDRFTCYRLSYPGLEVDLFAYAAKDSTEDGMLQILLEPVTGSERQVSALLEIKYPADADQENQVELVRIISKEWVVP